MWLLRHLLKHNKVRPDYSYDYGGKKTWDMRVLRVACLRKHFKKKKKITKHFWRDTHRSEQHNTNRNITNITDVFITFACGTTIYTSDLTEWFGHEVVNVKKGETDYPSCFIFLLVHDQFLCGHLNFPYSLHLWRKLLFSLLSCDSFTATALI